MNDNKRGFEAILTDAIDEERIYHARFRGDTLGGKHDPDPDDLEERLTQAARDIEQTVGCVAIVTREEADMFGISEYEDVFLWVLVPRHVDKELVHRVIEEARHRVMTDVLE
jgi:hypothetical protein